MNTKIDKTLQGSLIDDARTIIETARANAVRSVDFCRVQMYWNLGKRIFEEEQQGKDRADYGAYIVKTLAVNLEAEYGSGFGVRQLEQSRQFFRVYPNANTLRSQLNWSQYRKLIQIDDPDKREYYELESAIITHIADFLLEMGNGFTFVARQKRILLEDDEFFADLVFYNRILRCFVVVELKTGKLTHQDLGQLQMYVNYYDRIEKMPDENPTIGILLSTSKNDTVVKMTLPEINQTILASEYKLYLPTTDQLVKKINEAKQSVKKKQCDP